MVVWVVGLVDSWDVKVDSVLSATFSVLLTQPLTTSLALL